MLYIAYHRCMIMSYDISPTRHVLRYIFYHRCMVMSYNTSPTIDAWSCHMIHHLLSMHGVLLVDSSIQFRYFKVSARIMKARSYRAWRAKIFVLADESFGFYCAGGEPESIYYEEKTLVLNVLFKSEVDARRFRSLLQRRALQFCIISSVTVSESYEEVVLPTRAREIYATNYVHGESNSPEHSLVLSDYKS